MLFPFFGIGQTVPRLQEASHTFTLQDDSLSVYQTAKFHSLDDWFVDSLYIVSSSSQITLNIYYYPDLQAHTGFETPHTSYTLDTFTITNLSPAYYSLIVNSYEWGDSLDNNFNYYEFYTLRDSDTSYFHVLSDNSISFTKTPISFYPNPATEKLTIEGLKPEDGEVEVSIMEMNGKEIFQAQVSYQQPSLTLPALPKGTYLVKTSTSSVFQKLLIE